MFSFPLLNLIIGMVFIYLLMSMINQSVYELVIGLPFVRYRGKLMGVWLKTVLGTTFTYKNTQTSLGSMLIDHASISGLSGKGECPSYIAASEFARAVIEKINAGDKAIHQFPENLDELEENFKATDMLPDELKNTFISMIVEAKSTAVKDISQMDCFRSKIEAWFNNSMDRLSGYFKRKAQFWCYIIGTVLVILFNVDSITTAKFLYKNPNATSIIANQATVSMADSAFIQQYISVKAWKQNPSANPVADSSSAIKAQQMLADMQARSKVMNDNVNTLNTLIPIGWSSEELSRLTYGSKWYLVLLKKMAGLFLTILAVGMGAPFWFELLNKFINLRGTGPKPQVKTS